MHQGQTICSRLLHCFRLSVLYFSRFIGYTGVKERKA